MTAIQTLQTALELAAVLAVLWGVFNEGKLIKCERKLLRRIKRRFNK